MSPANDLEKARRTRTSAIWIGTSVVVLLLVFLIIFIAQNGQHVTLHFLGATGDASLAVGLLSSAVAGALIVLLIGAIRIIQLRLAQRRHLRRQQQLDDTNSQQSEASAKEQSGSKK